MDWLPRWRQVVTRPQGSCGCTHRYRHMYIVWWYTAFHHTHIYWYKSACALLYRRSSLELWLRIIFGRNWFRLGRLPYIVVYMRRTWSGMTSFYPLTNRRSSPASVNSSQHTIASLTHHHHIDDVSSYTKIYLFLKTKIIPSLMECAQLPLLCFFFLVVHMMNIANSAHTSLFASNGGHQLCASVFSW